MKHLLTYENHLKENHSDSSENMILWDVCNSILSGIPVWERAKSKIPKQTVLVVKDEGRNEEAHFNWNESTKERVVINADEKEFLKNRGTATHELVHAVQFMTGQTPDLFYTDATRDLSDLFDSEEWLKFLFSVYISTPYEIEAWEAELQKERAPEVVKDVVEWMIGYDPESLADHLMRLKVADDEWGISDASQLPKLWGDLYADYHEGGGSDSEEVNRISELPLQEFLRSFSQQFKDAADSLSKRIYTA